MVSYTNFLAQNVQSEKPTPDVTQKTTSSKVSEEIVLHHISSFLNNNLEALLSDYTDASVLITQDATYSNLEEIRVFFQVLSTHFPQHGSNFVLNKVVSDNDLVYIVWQAKTPSVEVPAGSDTFIIKDGKIYRQTFTGQLNFISQHP